MSVEILNVEKKEDKFVNTHTAFKLRPRKSDENSTVRFAQ